MDANFRAGGLASGLDTNSIIDSLTQLESRGLNQLRARQSGIKTQISAIGDLASRLSALAEAAKTLATNGVLGMKVMSTASGFGAAASSEAVSGRYSVQVEQLAQAARSRSQAFASGTSPVAGGTLHLDVMGERFDIPVGDGSALSDVAFAINRSGAPVSATILNDGTNTFLSLSSRETGHPLGTDPLQALQLSHTVTGTGGAAIGMNLIAPAKNARVTVDGLTFERRTNTVADAVPGVTLNLTSEVSSPQDLVVDSDTGSTTANLKKFVDAYNDLLGRMNRQLQINETTNRDTTLAGDRSVQSLQQRLQKMIGTEVPGLTTVRTLADLGVKTNRDGTLTINDATLSRAISRDPSAVNAVFQQAQGGLAAELTQLARDYTDPAEGVFTARRKGMDQSVRRMDADLEKMQFRIDKFRKNLIAQYAAMEKVVSGIKSIGSYLTQQDAVNSRKTS